MQMFSFHVAEPDAGARLDRFLAGQPALCALALSRTRLKSLIEGGHVTVAGAPAQDPAAKLARGADVALVVPPAAPATPQPERIALPIVFEDEALIVLDKPAGLVVHPAAGHARGTLVNALLAHCGDRLSGVGGVLRPGIVHRLDKDTSGLMVVAKTDVAHRGLSRLFADHGRTTDFAREYTAVVWGAPDRAAGVVEAPLGRHPHARDRMAITRDGKEAITHWRTQRTFGRDRGGRPLAALIGCALETGRTHQIRVHMASLGHPLIGDGVYGSGFKTKVAHAPEAARAAIAAFARQALHATRLAFAHPVTGEFFDFASEPPTDLARLIRALQNA